MKRLTLLFAALLVGVSLFAQKNKKAQQEQEAPPQEEAQQPAVNADGVAEDGSILKYRRSSLYSIQIQHPTFPYAETIASAFLSMPMPDKFNDHNLDVRAIVSSASKMKAGGAKKEEANLADIDKFIAEQHVPREMVAKWFHRDAATGGFDMSLIQDRGFYDASAADIAAAAGTERNLAMLGDAGEDLIAKTFLIVNDITFVDKGERSQKVGGFLKALGSIAEAVGVSGAQDLGNMAGGAVNEIDGFRVNITTYLYRLAWNDEIAGTFYKDHWFMAPESDDARRKAFDECPLFKLDYVGKTTTSAQNLSSKSLSSKPKEEQMLKVCTRAVDKAIVQLQREYDEFKVNVPVSEISEDGKEVKVQVGLKEGLNLKSRYEVLMAVSGEDGKRTYKHIGTLAPVKDKIWDNRFGALEDAEAVKEGAKADETDGKGDPTLGASTFKVVSGKVIPGCLVREATIKRG